MKSYRHVNYLWDDAKAATLDPVGRLVYRSNLLVRDGNSSVYRPVDLPASTSSNTALQFSQINSLGLGVTVDGRLWLNGQVLGPTDFLSASVVNTDLTVNATALVPGVSWGNNTTLTVGAVANTTLLAIGQIADDFGERSHLAFLVPMENPFIMPSFQMLGFTFQFNVPYVLPVNSSYYQQKITDRNLLF